jgi:hypothetical protein
MPEVAVVSNQRAVRHAVSGTVEAIRHWSRMVRGAYLEIPGLRLTRVQVQHLWDLEVGLSDTVLDALVDERFLQRTPEGGFVCAPRPSGTGTRRAA